MKKRQSLKIKTFLNIAQQLSKLSTCQRLQVGAVLTQRDYTIISAGYNGRAYNTKHCCDSQCAAQGGCDCIHRQQNRIMFGGSKFKSRNKIAFLTHSPCLICRKMLVQFGVNNIYYLNEYRSIEQTKLYLDKNNIWLWKEQH